MTEQKSVVIFRRFEECFEQLRKWVPESVLCLCAGSVEHAESYRLSLQSARENLKHLFYGSDSRGLMELPPVGERPSLPVERFETAIRSGDRKDAAACIKELAEWFSRMRCWCWTIEEMSILPSNG